ncbi:MAG: type I secretion system permease/ATPase [Hyphomicrobiales bacterium]|nr:MAG: type I secretion system permease/ATPase [Hyphomicrobiales bacterium]
MLNSTASQRTSSQRPAAAIVSPLKSVIFSIALISGIVNLLALTAPLFMLQIYDRVLSSGSISTLIGLAVLALGLYIFQALLDIVRARIFLRIGEDFDHQLSARTHAAIVLLPLETRMPGDGLQPLRDLDNVRGFLSGQGPIALFDLPWMPLYLGICFVFHFWIGMTALVGAIVLVALTVLTDALSREPTQQTITHGMTRNALMEAGRRNAEVVRSMGLGGRIAEKWQEANSLYLKSNRRTGDIANTLGGIAKALRIMLQSGILGVGAWLVIQQEVSAGVMIASSVMMGRALAPIDMAIGSWKGFLMARQSWARLKDVFSFLPEETKTTALPRPKDDFVVKGVTIVPPGETTPTVSNVSFAISAGSALGIIGPSGCGKSTLARALVGAWTPARGEVRIDGASFDQWDPEIIGSYIGYLPQGVELFDGTIAENICRFDRDPDPEVIIAAAKAAGAHELIVGFSKGYDTRMGESGSALSAGQRQRVGLARALYGDPFLIVLDEPNANLDAEGEAALVKAIACVRERGGIVIIIAHRPSALGVVDLLLAMEGGRAKAFGPRDEILSKVLKTKEQKTVVPATKFTGRSVTPFRVVANQSMNLLKPIEDNNPAGGK